MVSSRPLLYLSLPGVAFILGVFWFRRRNKNRSISDDTAPGGKEAEKVGNGDREETIQKEILNGTLDKAAPVRSNSVNINGSSSSPDDTNSATKLFGKSAPIKIVQSGRGSPMKQSQQHQIDTEALKVKIQDAGHKVLRSIDEDFENLSSPVDLPDSVNNRGIFCSRNINSNKDEPVVIKATTTPKISPENSFLESKYIKDNEQNNNLQLEEKVVSMQPEQKEGICEEHLHELPQSESIQNMESNFNSNSEKRNADTSSPTLSLCSVQSGDSGKGSSLPRSEAARAKTTYEFFFPNCLVGQLYGRKRSFINQIKAKTSANVIIRKSQYARKLRICAIEGTENEINAALAMIRQRLPAKRYPNFTMQRIHFALPQTVVPLSTESLLNLQLNLIEGINNDIIVSSVISGGHIFVQHPLHPSHPSLAVLQKCLYESYTNTEAPMLPTLEISAVCVLPVNSIWYRVQIVEQDTEEDKRCIVKFLDFGGYMNVHFNDLRQIRTDFMSVPFQATECILSNIDPIDSSWSSEAADILCKLTKGIVLQAQVAGYNSHNIPEIYLFACLGPNNVIFINKELVARNLAKWVELRE